MIRGFSMIRQVHYIVISVAMLVICLSSSEVVAEAKDEIVFIPISTSTWKNVDGGWELNLELKNGDKGMCNVLITGSDIYYNRICNRIMEEENTLEGIISFQCPAGSSTTFKYDWSLWLMKVGKVDLRHNGIEELFFVDAAGNTAECWNYNILNLQEKEIISYTYTFGHRDDSIGEKYPSSPNFNDPRFKKEAEFLEKLANEWDVSKER